MKRKRKLGKKNSPKKLAPSHAWHLEPSSQMKVAFQKRESEEADISEALKREEWH